MVFRSWCWHRPRYPRLSAFPIQAQDAEKATLQNAVTATDRQIDGLVYDLYALTPEEIALVEGGT